MICCNDCPLNPSNANFYDCCPEPECDGNTQHNCTKLPYTRCYLETFVINKLYQKNELAIKLAGLCVKKAVASRDRATLISIFQAAPEELRKSLWQALIETEPRSIWLLNPVFQAAGLAPLKDFSSFNPLKSEYYFALMQNPYSGSFYCQVCNLF